jgi:hypothetical protein
VPTGEEQSLFVSTTCRVSVPAAPAVKVIRFVPFPAVIVPLPIVHAYVLPVCAATDAVKPAAPGSALCGAVIAGVEGAVQAAVALTVHDRE